MNLKSTLLLLTVLTIFSSCASIFGGRANSFVFNEESLPTAKIYLDDEYVGDAPGKIILPKKKIQHGSKLEIKAEGYETQEFLILRKIHPLYSIADLLTGVVWLGVDFGNGNIYRPSPRTFSYNLKKNN